LSSKGQRSSHYEAKYGWEFYQISNWGPTWTN